MLAGKEVRKISALATQLALRLDISYTRLSMLLVSVTFSFQLIGLEKSRCSAWAYETRPRSLCHHQLWKHRWERISWCYKELWVSEQFHSQCYEHSLWHEQHHDVWTTWLCQERHDRETFDHITTQRSWSWYTVGRRSTSSNKYKPSLVSGNVLQKQTCLWWTRLNWHGLTKKEQVSIVIFVLKISFAREELLQLQYCWPICSLSTLPTDLWVRFIFCR